MLPGKGIDTAITAEVKDFQMPAVSINGVPMSINIEVDDEVLLKEVRELTDAVKKLDSGAGELVDGISKLSDGAGELKSGTKEMKEKTDGMDGKISDKIDEMLSSITGENEQTVPFVSEKNTNVKSVQVVIQTEGIKTEETKTATPEAEEKLNFWQKLLRVFGLY